MRRFLGLIGLLALCTAPRSFALPNSSVSTLTESDDCAEIGATVRTLAAGDSSTFMQVTASLRKTLLENPGEHHRLRARSSLIALLLAKSPSNRDVGPNLLTCEAPIATPAWPLYFMTEDGAQGAETLLDVLLRVDGANAAGVRLVAANSLQLVGSEPSDAAINTLLGVVKGEADPAARLEETLALAAFADHSHTAFKALRELLLTDPSCQFAEGVAFNLPSHDLRLVLYKKVGSSPRAAKLKRWVRGQGLGECSDSLRRVGRRQHA